MQAEESELDDRTTSGRPRMVRSEGRSDLDEILLDWMCERGLPVSTGEVRDSQPTKRLVADLAQATFVAPRIGESWQGFEILDELGSGSLSQTFLAVDDTRGSGLVVLKLSPLPTLESEYQGTLSHPRIMPILRLGDIASTGIFVSVMPYLGRATLFDLIQQMWVTKSVPRRASSLLELAIRMCGRHLPEGSRTSVIHSEAPLCELTLEIGIGLGEALAHAHDRGIIHGDVKPSNILLSASGEPILLDFDLAYDRMGASPGGGGTIPYMSLAILEQFVVDGCTLPSPRWNPLDDVHALSATLFELFTGHLPFGAPDPEWPISEQVRWMRASQLQGVAISERFANPPATGALLAEREVFDLLRRYLETPAQNTDAIQFVADARRCLQRCQSLRRRDSMKRRAAVALGSLGLLLCSFLARSAFLPANEDSAVAAVRTEAVELLVESRRLSDKLVNQVRVGQVDAGSVQHAELARGIKLQLDRYDEMAERLGLPSEESRDLRRSIDEHYRRAISAVHP